MTTTNSVVINPQGSYRPSAWRTEPPRKASKVEAAALSKQLSNPIDVPSVDLTLLPDRYCEPAKPFHQYKTAYQSVIDIGSRRTRSFMLLPSLACPVLACTQTKTTGLIHDIGTYDESDGSHLFDSNFATGKFVLTPDSVIVPPSRSLIVQRVFLNNSNLFIPFHGALTTAASVTATSSISALVPTARLSTSTGQPSSDFGLPFNSTDELFISAKGFSRAGALPVAGDYTASMITFNSAGAYTVTAMTASNAVVGHEAHLGFSAVAPAGAVGLVGAYITSAVAAAILDMHEVRARIATYTGAADYDLGMVNGFYTGGTAPDFDVVAAGCSKTRVTAASILVTNITNFSSVNGIMYANAFGGGSFAQDRGVVSHEHLSDSPGNYAGPSVNGCFIALDCHDQNRFEPVSSLPRAVPAHALITMFGDDSSNQVKVTYCLVVEGVSEQPIFRPSDVSEDPVLMRAIAESSLHPYALVISANDSHMAKLKELTSKVMGFVKPLLSKVVMPGLMYLGGGAPAVEAYEFTTAAAENAAKEFKSQNKPQKVQAKVPPGSQVRVSRTGTKGPMRAQVIAPGQARSANL